jgi:hypothetical protein
VNEQQRARIAALPSDFPRLWQDPKTPDRERRRMVRLLLADVTLIRGNGITVHFRFSGGVAKMLDARVAETLDRLGTQNNAGRDCRRG